MSSRRGKGEGNIRQRAGGLWEARIDLGWIDGKHRRKSIYGKTRQEVQDRLVRARADAQVGLLSTAKGESVGAFLGRWLAGLDLEPLTVRAYTRWTRSHIIPSIGHIRLEKLTPQDVDTMLKAKLRDGLSPQSVHHIRAVLRVALARAVKFGLVPRNVAALADPPRVKQYAAMFLSPAQVDAFLAAAKGDRLEALYACALALGLRQGEALGLRWQDVDLDARRIRVCSSLKRIAGQGLVLGGTKWGSDRTVTLPDTTVRHLRGHAKRQELEKRIAGSLWVDTGLVFTTHEGRPLSATHVIRDSFKPLVRRAGLPERLRMHDLRHSAATILLAQGVPARVVMELLGHSRVNITLDRYSHVVPQLMEDAARAMDRALGAS